MMFRIGYARFTTETASGPSDCPTIIPETTELTLSMADERTVAMKNVQNELRMMCEVLFIAAAAPSAP